jgi:YidC/Oxa1 family membrane protein insertase
VLTDKEQFATQGWLWIGTAFAASSPYHILAANLSVPDYVLLAMYVVSMYFQVRLTSPALDPQQAQQQKIMAFVSPVMVATFGVKYHWPSALIIYWLSFNLFSMAQQFYLMRKYRGGLTPATAGGAAPAAIKGASTGAALTNGKSGTNGTLATGTDGTAPKAIGPGSARSTRKRRSSRR